MSPDNHSPEHRIIFEQHPPLSFRLQNVLSNANMTFWECALVTEQHMLTNRNFGRKTLKELRDKLNSCGLDFLGNGAESFFETAERLEIAAKKLREKGAELAALEARVKSLSATNKKTQPQ